MGSNGRNKPAKIHINFKNAENYADNKIVLIENKIPLKQKRKLIVL